jgi:CCR4-NOT transcription complex subunit 3
MERFKAVEKAMKTKAYSKEGLSAAAKLDPQEEAKEKASEYLGIKIDELEQQIEGLEAESQMIKGSVKKGRLTGAKAERVSSIETIIERHKWHQSKLELIRRSLENGGVEREQVDELKDSIDYYITDGMNDDYIDDDTIYDDLNLDEEEDAYGIVPENDKGSSQDNQSIQDEAPEPEPSRSSSKSKGPVESAAAASGRRPSTQLKSPLPTLATLHTPHTNAANGATSTSNGMKPASLPTRPAGEGLKYASAAAAAAASDKNNVGIAPLPPPPGAQSVSNPAGISPLPPIAQVKTSAANSPNFATIQPASSESRAGKVPGSSTVQDPKPSGANVPASKPGPIKKGDNGKGKGSSRASGQALASANAEPAEPSKPTQQTNGVSNGVKSAHEQEEESIYHLPASLQDLVESFEVTKKRPLPANSPSHLRMMAASQVNLNTLDHLDSEPPRTYRPEVPYASAAGYPQEPLPIFDDPRLYSRIEPDTLFYVFYYKQGTYQQHLAAKALKDQSWRFHKQYQTWFQRHEEPKSITEEFEQGTYRFFDYESTWMNRRKADFKFAYRFLEDDV